MKRGCFFKEALSMRSISPQTAGYMVFPEQHLKGHFDTPNGV